MCRPIGNNAVTSKKNDRIYTIIDVIFFSNQYLNKNIYVNMFASSLLVLLYLFQFT